MVYINLDAYLYNLHIGDDPLCPGSYSTVEDCKHFIFKCPLYETQSMKLINNVLKLYYKLLEVLLNDNDNINLCNSKIIFSDV